MYQCYSEKTKKIKQARAIYYAYAKKLQDNTQFLINYCNKHNLQFKKYIYNEKQKNACLQVIKERNALHYNIFNNAILNNKNLLINKNFKMFN